MIHRRKAMVFQWVGIFLLIPGLIRVPLPQADFHIIRHHHGVGEVCPQHDHLLRWHPQAGEGDDVAVLHWHWLVPQSLDVDVTGASPALHAHVADSLQPEWDGDRPTLSVEARSRTSTGLDDESRIDVALIGVPLPDILPGAPLAPKARLNAMEVGPPASSSLARLVRWNC